MWELALPVLLEQLMVILVAFVDQWLAGRYLEDDHLAAMGFIWYALWAIPTMFSLVASGSTALTARFVGAKSVAAEDAAGGSANGVLNQSLLLGALLAVIPIALIAFWSEPILSAMRLQGQAAKLAEVYLWYILPIVPAMMIEEIGIACLRGAGDTRTGLWVRLVVNAVNLLLGVTLVTGIGGAPKLGWQGLAIASAAGFLVGGGLIFAMLYRGQAGLRWQRRLLRPDGRMQWRILRVGVPGGADSIATVGIHMWFLAIINSLGVLPAAAHGLAVRIEALTYLPGVAFLVAASTMTGQCLGAKQPARAVRCALLCLAWGGGIMGISSASMYIWADPLTRVFLGEQNLAVAREAAPLLRIVAISLPAFAVLMILSGALRGAGDTRLTLLITFAGLLLVRIPLAYWWATDAGLGPWAQGLGWGVQGAWYAMLVDIALRGSLTLTRFVHGGWKELDV